MTNDDREDTLADNMDELTKLATVLCSLSKDINFELEEQTEQCARIIAKVPYGGGGGGSSSSSSSTG